MTSSELAVRPPTFLGIGAPRCGTTWIYRCLEEHPEVFTSSPKELHYFNNYYDRGDEWYLDHFRPAPRHKAWGEITPTYISRPHVPERVKALCSDARLFVILREPVARAHSLYLLKRDSTFSGQTFEEAIEKRPDILTQGLYASHLRRWFDLFPREQMLVALYDDMIASEAALMRRIYEHVGVDPEFRPSWLGKTYNALILPGLREKLRKLGLEPLVGLVKRSPAGDWIRKMHRTRGVAAKRVPALDQAMLDRLRDYYAAPNRELEDLLDIELRW